MALDNGAVLQRLEIGHIVPDVLALTDWKNRGTQTSLTRMHQFELHCLFQDFNSCLV